MIRDDKAAVQHVLGHLADIRQLLTGAGSGYGVLSPMTKGEDGATLRESFVSFRETFPEFFENEPPISVENNDSHDPL
jgi:hypothetical protein